MPETGRDAAAPARRCVTGSADSAVLQAGHTGSGFPCGYTGSGLRAGTRELAVPGTAQGVCACAG